MTDNKVYGYINDRLIECGREYESDIIGWCSRGSIGIGICRYNSDLDITFWFAPKDKNIHAIHDIYGYGYDGWGENIADSLKMAITNLEDYYVKGAKDYLPIWESNEHKRGGLDYKGLYSLLGNEFSWVSDNYNKELYSVLERTMEPVVLTKFVYVRVKPMLEKFKSVQQISACDYLYTIWRLLICEHILHGGLPGEEKIANLMNLYAGQKEKEIVDLIIKQYYNTFSKNSMVLRNELLDDMIFEKVSRLDDLMLEIEPKHDNSCIEELEQFIEQLT